MDDTYCPEGPLDRACESEDELKALRALRRKIASTLDSTKDARTIASLSKHLSDVLARMSEIKSTSGSPVGVEPAGVSSLDKYRVARVSGADD